MADGQITIRMSADLKAAAEQIRDNKRAQQEMADALGVSVTEYRKIERELQRKQAAEKKATAEVKQHATAQRQSTAATQGATLATRGASTALSAMGVSAHAALGPLGLITGAVAALGAGAYAVGGRMSATVDEVNNLAESTGTSTRMVLALRHAVSATGGDLGKTQQALQHFVKSQDLAGKSAAEVDRALTDAIRRIEQTASEADRAALRMEVFGTKSAVALAALSGEAMNDAIVKTASLADKIERAGGASTEWDQASADLNTRLTETSVILGGAVSPAIVGATRVMEALTFSFNEGLQFILTGETSVDRMMRDFDALRTRRLADLQSGRALFDEMWAEMDAEPPAVQVQPPDPRAIAEAKRHAEQVAKATADARQSIRRAEFAQQVAEDAERARMAEEGALRLAQIEEQERIAAEQAHADTMRRLAEEEAARIHMARVRQDAIADTVGGLADLVAASTASAEAIAAARIMETLAYGSVAFGRALAEVGPIAGIPIAIGNAAAIAAQIAAVKSAPSRHMGGPAPDEGVVRVRNNERVTFEPATKRRDNGGQTMATLTIDNQAYRAMARRSARQDSIFGQRRREAVEVGR
jgi:hypothetical protein